MPDVPSDPKDVLRRFFATLSSGDFDAIGAFFGDDSVWMVNDVARGFPSERGRRAIIEDFLQPVREGLFEPGDPKVEVVRMIGEGDWVVAETVGRGKLRNGNTYENSYVSCASTWTPPTPTTSLKGRRKRAPRRAIVSPRTCAAWVTSWPGVPVAFA
jgi:ketosteroid isomerase-like protein